jgi:prepilin-type N-terminal cleavage/methylation domain-containing protein
MRGNSRGFSLIELVVVMGMFVVIIAVAGDAFNVIMKNAAQQSRTAESNIEGVAGLELLRKDLTSAGFGLPWSFLGAVNYNEVNPDAGVHETIAAAYNGTGGVEAQTLVPRAIFGGNNVTPSPADATKLITGSDYLVIRSTSIGTDTAAQRWSFMNYTSQTKPASVVPGTWAVENLGGDDYVIVIRVGLTSPITKELVMSGSSFTTKFSTLSVDDSAYAPRETKVSHYIYGVSSAQPRMPFNRADYYVRAPASTDAEKLPKRCAPNTGILYKAVVNQSDGTITGSELPLLDCVADMQVVYTLDSTNNGTTTDTDTLTTTTTPITPLTAEQIRNQLKSMQVYVLTHEGGRDMMYTYPNQNIAVGPSVDGITASNGRTFNLATNIGTGWNRYRWKVYHLTVRPSNLGLTLQ